MLYTSILGDEMSEPLRILFLGASYGVVLGMRIAAAGHRVVFVCQQEEIRLIKAGRVALEVPARESPEPLLIEPKHCAFPPDACPPDEVDPLDYDLVCLAMQEPQYGASGVRVLLQRIALARVPCLSVMNMPLPPYLNGVVELDERVQKQAFSEPGLWQRFDPALFSMASADPQAIRRDVPDQLLVAVNLPTNFKVAPFQDYESRQLLERLSADIDLVRVPSNNGLLHPRVRLRAHPSRFVPLAKWPMLITGNFRCMTEAAPRSIADAVTSDLPLSRDLYEWVVSVCLKLGAEEATMVSFDRYLDAARGLSLPSSVSRGLYAGSTAVERIDFLVQSIALRYGMAHPALDQIVADVSGTLERNRKSVAAKHKRS
jgi:hypothetical protein